MPARFSPGNRLRGFDPITHGDSRRRSHSHLGMLADLGGDYLDDDSRAHDIDDEPVDDEPVVPGERPVRSPSSAPRFRARDPLSTEQASRARTAGPEFESPLVRAGRGTVARARLASLPRNRRRDRPQNHRVRERRRSRRQESPIDRLGTVSAPSAVLAGEELLRGDPRRVDMGSGELDDRRRVAPLLRRRVATLDLLLMRKPTTKRGTE